MKKDTIYIDIEDDITSIVARVKKATEQIVALVPPKRTGVLQSSVNLKLLKKAADGTKKHLVLITADPALKALAAGAQIPVAKNLQSKPELAELPDEEADDDVIRGEEIAIGDLAKTAEPSKTPTHEPEDKELSAAVAKLDGDEDETAERGKKAKSGKKIPNFDKFRKRIIIFGGLGLALIVFLVWAIWFAPRAKIIVLTKTSSESISTVVTLDPNTATNIENNVLQPIVKQTKKANTIDFDATGTKDIGEKATGDVNVYNDRQPISGYTCNPASLPAGTIIASGSLQFALDGAVTVPCGDAMRVSVTAAQIGPNYNIGANTNLLISGQGDLVYAVARSAFSGGSKETVKVVQQSDIDKVADRLKSQDESARVKDELKSQMGSDVTLIDESFVVAPGDITSKPAVGERADRATASLEVTYSIVAIGNRDLNDLLDKLAMKTTDNVDNQRVYDNGLAKLQTKDFRGQDGNRSSVRLVTTAKIGPKLDEDKIRTNSAGLRSGEIRAILSDTPGVESVEVNFSPFWVSRAPDAKKIKVELRSGE